MPKAHPVLVVAAFIESLSSLTAFKTAFERARGLGNWVLVLLSCETFKQ